MGDLAHVYPRLRLERRRMVPRNDRMGFEWHAKHRIAHSGRLPQPQREALHRYGDLSGEVVNQNRNKVIQNRPIIIEGKMLERAFEVQRVI